MAAAFLALILAMGMAWPANAAVSPFRTVKVPKTKTTNEPNAPVMLEAREVGYDHEKSMVVARGDVEIVQGDRILQADQVTYEQATDTVRADGNVKLLQPDGNVLFSNHMVLHKALKTGIVENFRARLVDNSVFAAREARRVDDHTTVMHQAVYSPCKLPDCKTAKEHGLDPMWQIRADKIVQDTQEQTIAYKNPRMEVYGVPVLYAPYLKHASPGADAQRGFLVPDYGTSSILGVKVRTPYYIPIEPTSDATITPIFTSKEGTVLAGQYRQLLEKGYMEFNASITDPQKRDSLGNLADGNEIRGHVAGYGNYALDSVWNAGFQLNRATDDTYMRRYGFGQDLTLTSRMFVEGEKDRTHAIVQGVAFQGLEATDDAGQEPYVLPLASYETESAQGWEGSRIRMQASTMALTRTDGTDTRRASSTVGWRLPVTTDAGHVFEVNTELRGDIYNVDNFNYQNNLNAPVQDYAGTVTRAIPQASATWRFPLQRPIGNASWVLEPTAGVAISPNGTNDPRIPNEDSSVLEYNDINLFSFDHYPGIDQVETGARGYYGLRNQLLLPTGTSLYTLVGQNYQQNDNNNFPYTSTLDDHYSDYIGLVGMNSNWMNASYRFRLAQQNLALQRQEASLQLIGNFTTLSFDYVDISNDPYVLARNELSANASLVVSKEWTTYGYARRDLNEGRMVAAGGGVVFLNECFNWTLVASREFTQDRDIVPNTSIITQIFLKNIN